MEGVKSDAGKKNEKQKKLPYFRIIFFITLLIFIIYIGQIIERDYKNSKILGAEDRKPRNSRLDFVIKDKIQSVFHESVKTAEKSVDQVLRDATDYAVKTASKEAENIKDTIFQSTVGTIVQQIDKLPDKQKEEIKKDICK